MNRLRFLLCILFIATIMVSCSKDDSLYFTQDKIENLSAHKGHIHFEHQNLPEGANGFEAYAPIIKLIDHDIYSFIETILPDKFSAGEIDLLEQGYVKTYEDDGKAVYTIDFEYNENSIKKVLVAVDSENTVESINILETFIGSLNNSVSLHNVVIDSVVIYPMDSERSTKGKSYRNSPADCKKIVFGDGPSGGTTGTNEPGGDGTTVVSTPGGTFGSGNTYSSGDYLYILICGCKPSHAGGSGNSECNCKKADRLLIVKKPDTIKGDEKGGEARNDQDYWDCVEDLIGCEMLNDYDLAIQTLKHCHGVYDVNDVDNHAGNDGSNQFIGPEFCDDWFDYQQECLNGSTSVSDVYQPWAGFMIDYPDLFFNTIEALPECVSTDEIEEIVCVEDAYNELIETYDITPSANQEAAIKEGASCGDDLVGKATTIYENEYFIIDAGNGSVIDLKQKLEDCFGIPDEEGNFIDCTNNEGDFNFTIYVEQPNPGTRDTYSGSIFNPDEIDVGHTFISLSYTNESITNTIVYGLYPSSAVKPTAPESTRAIKNDSKHEYDVAMSFNVSCLEFNNIISRSLNIESQNYNLNSNNCTDFGLNLANSVDFGIPDSQGKWGFWSGSNPGDLGEDLKNYSSVAATLINEPGFAPETNCN